jgi:receptor protein-tyrosine kinase
MHSVVSKLVDRNPARDRSIGAILIEAGRLDGDSADKILKLQKQKKILFGEAAIQLGLLKKADIEFALARQFDFPFLQRGESLVSEEVAAAYDPFTAQVEVLRAIRSQLMLHWLETGSDKKTLAITSAERQEGRSWLAANLAVVFSQLGERTLLVDADLRNPMLHHLLGLNNRMGLAEVLSGRTVIDDAIQRVPSLLDLSVISAGAMPPNPQEVLSRCELDQILKLMRGQYDIIIVDTPAISECADSQIIAARCGYALLVARRHATRVRAMESAARALRKGGVSIVGNVVLEH